MKRKKYFKSLYRKKNDRKIVEQHTPIGETCCEILIARNLTCVIQKSFSNLKGLKCLRWYWISEKFICEDRSKRDLIDKLVEFLRKAFHQIVSFASSQSWSQSSFSKKLSSSEPSQFCIREWVLSSVLVRRECPNISYYTFCRDCRHHIDEIQTLRFY